MIRQLIFYGAIGYVGYYAWEHSPAWVLLFSFMSILGLAALLIYPHVAHLRPGGRRSSNYEAQRLASMALAQLTPGDFEREVARAVGVFAGDGNVRVVGHSGDAGIDVEMLDKGKLVGVIQCKHKADPRHTVGPEVIRDMDSTMHRAGAQYAFVITNGHFTSGSRELAKQYNIGLLDGQAFERFRQRANAPTSPLTSSLLSHNIGSQTLRRLLPRI
jgi:hypothetical protein